MNEENDDKTGANIENRQARRRRLRQLRRRVGDRLGFAFYVAALALVLATGWAACANVVKSGWGADAAAWTQAAGSIAAIVGAAWLAQSESRRARRLHRERREEAAWYVRFAIRLAQFESHIVAHELVNRTTPVQKSDVREWRQRATTSAIGLNALVDRTDYIHPAVTQVTSNAKVLMDDLVTDLASLSSAVEEGRKLEDDLIGQIVAPHRALLDLIDLYDARMRGIKAALDEGDDALPIKEWSAWNTGRESPAAVAPTTDFQPEHRPSGARNG